MQPFQFNIKSLLVVSAFVCIFLALTVFPDEPGSAIWRGFILINAFGFLVAIFITKVLKFPTDGGYRDPEIRKEQELANQSNGKPNSNS